ncbi:hypothetical protein ABIA33_003572 [Streptacidiphilus sp. MAP12-16]|jgi:hypothetical protein|uniref:hypothetical protein n=1 Tax=Streptacidiphilus sp. MAP12-16 TaxID=3156300 RepID=UPI0035121E1B
MAIIAVFDLPGMTQAQYEAATNKLNKGRGLVKASSDWPVPGLIAHISGPSPTGWYVADVWDSEESFAKFGEIIVPILQDLGVTAPQPKVFPAFNVVTG